MNILTNAEAVEILFLMLGVTFSLGTLLNVLIEVKSCSEQIDELFCCATIGLVLNMVWLLITPSGTFSPLGCMFTIFIWIMPFMIFALTLAILLATLQGYFDEEDTQEYSFLNKNT